MASNQFPVIIFPNNPRSPDIEKPGFSSGLYLKSAASVWLILLSVVCIMVFLDPFGHTVTPVYHMAVEKWLSNESLYSSNVMHYFPQFVFMFMPFHLCPVPVGDILWRIISVGLLAWSLWRLVGLEGSPRNAELFLYVSLLAIAPCIGAIRNGQANVVFAALTIHAAVSIARSQWWIATVCLIVALISKPIGLVMMLLASAVYRPLIPRLCIGLALFLSFPFFFGGPFYVFSQYQQFYYHMIQCSLILKHIFADLNGLLRFIGIGLPGNVSQIVRICAGIVTLGLWWVGSARTKEPERAWLLLGLTTAYLMLFNPMTEVNSYVIVAPVIAFYAVHFLKIEDSPVLGWGLALSGLSIGLLPEIFSHAVRGFGLLWDPLMAIVFFVFLVSMVLSKWSPKKKSLQIPLP